MAEIISLEALGVLLAWTVTGYAIWKWGPGLRTRKVRCPDRGVRARVLAEQREGDFACLHVVDLSACSLAHGGVLTCDKKCISQL